MFRWGVVRLGSASGAAAAAAAVGSSSETHARVRPSRFARPDGWLPFSMEGDDVVFGPEEVKETIEDVLGIANRENMEEMGSDTESVESFGADADAIIDSSTKCSMEATQTTGMQLVANFTENLLGRKSMQIAMIEAMDQDPSIKFLFRDIFGQQGERVQIFEYPYRGPLLPPLEEQCPIDGGGEEKRNIFDVIFHAILHGFGAAGNFLGKIGNWMKTRFANESIFKNFDENFTEVEREFGGREKLSGAVLCFASVVMLVLVAKRLGVLRILRVVAP